MAQTDPPHLDFWERWSWIWSAVFYLSLVVPGLVIFGDLASNERVWLVVLVLFGCGWHWFWVVGLPQRLSREVQFELRGRPFWVIIYLIGIVVIWLQLTAIDRMFFIHLSGLFSQFFVFLHIVWAMVGTTILTAVVLFQDARLNGETISLQDPSVWSLGLAVLGANLFGLWINGIINESNKRRELLEELRQTQAELAASERRSGVLSERQRLAHEIHDTLAQGFIGIIMHLEAAQSLSNEQAELGLPQARQHIQQAEQMARQNLKQARYLVEDLRPEPLQQASLPEAITQTVEQWREQSKVAAHVTITGEERPLPANTEHTFLRVTQEALANIHKHAQATEVTVTLSYMGDCVMLDVQDDGVGLNGAISQWQGGFGLTAMRERVEQLGGSMLVESEDEEGTTVVVSIPVIGD